LPNIFPPKQDTSLAIQSPVGDEPSPSSSSGPEAEFKEPGEERRSPSSSPDPKSSQRARQGPKGHSLEEQDRACEEYLNGLPDIKQFMIAAKYNVSVRQFQRWLASYRERRGIA
jgi:hypothetical protein